MPLPFTPGEILTADNLNDALAGWQHITEASIAAAATFTITIPSSTYKMVRVTIQGSVASGEQALRARVNNDSTASLHAYILASFLSDTVATSPVSTTSWVVGAVTTNQGCMSQLLIYNTDTSSALPFSASSNAFHATEANARQFQSGGQLAANRLLSTLVIFPDASTFTGHYIAEGYRLPV